MCLLIFAHRVAREYPLVVAANRDEFHARPTARADFWPDHPQLLAGRDLEQGGTWMGATRQGRFAAITNYRDPARTAPAPRSRGELPLEFLVGEDSADSYMRQLRVRAGDYAGFNLLLGDGQELWYYSNSAADNDPHLLAPGIYGLSNAQLDTPWPKVKAGKRQLETLLEAEPDLDHDSLAAVVADRGTAAPRELMALGLDGEMDQVLSSQFIVTSSYGTRSSTTLWRTFDGTSHWRELSYDPSGRLSDTRQFTVPSQAVASPGS
jgi:uncharacterized protein with NRDE domain